MLRAGPTQRRRRSSTTCSRRSRTANSWRLRDAGRAPGRFLIPSPGLRSLNGRLQRALPAHVDPVADVPDHALGQSLADDERLRVAVTGDPLDEGAGAFERESSLLGVMVIEELAECPGQEDRQVALVEQGVAGVEGGGLLLARRGL